MRTSVNCVYADKYGFCSKKPKVWKFFKPSCCEVELKKCDVAKRYPRPTAPPPSPRSRPKPRPRNKPVAEEFDYVRSP